MKQIFLSLILILTFSLSALSANITVEREKDAPNFIRIQNQWLTLRIDLSRGALVSSLLYKGFEDQDIISDPTRGNGGLFKDLWTTQGWPGEFNQRIYEAEILEKGPEKVVVRTWTTGTGAYKNQKDENLSDILVEKTFKLDANSRVLTVEVALTNKGKKGKRVSYWSQSAIDFDGKLANNKWWRPTKHGVDWITQQRILIYAKSINGYWYTAPVTAGWNGVSNPNMKRGIMFLMDYNDIEQVYDNTAANTTEWMYDTTAIPVGRTWKTTMNLIPTEGFPGYSYGDLNVVGYCETQNTPSGLSVDHLIAASSVPLRNVTVRTEARGIVDKWKAESELLKTNELGYAPLARTVGIRGIGIMPCVIKTTVTGTKPDGVEVTAVYEDYFGGAVGKNSDLVTLDPLHAFVAPTKKKTYLKPDKIELSKNEKTRILFIRGLWSNFQGVDEALKKMGDVEVVDGWMKRAPFGEVASGFPAGYDELMSYNLIILGNVSGPMLGDLGQEMLSDYIQAGGGVLMLSGDRTFGQADFKNENFLKVLPLTFAGYGDYALMKEPSPLLPKDKHPILNGVDLPAGDIVLYSHSLNPIKGAITPLVFADGRPALILSGEKGRHVAALAPLPFGNAPSGKELYCRGDQYHRLMANLMKWLMGTMEK
jgi:uncharacterized membrane protein